MASTEAAIVHDYFVQDGGAERVAVELARLLPHAPIFTTFFDERQFGGRIDPGRVHTWPLSGHFDAKLFRRLLPLYPAYFSALDLRPYRLVVSSTSAFAKGVRTSQRGLHVAYVHAPMRFAWQFDHYARGSSLGRPARMAGSLLSGPLRSWDRRTSARPDLLVANSNAVRERIFTYWGRDSTVVYPPVDVEEVAVSTRREGFLLVVARLLAYRRVDLAVDAANISGRRLIVVGDGPERGALERRAGPTVTFEGFVPRPRLLDLLAGCDAYLAPGEEDFGIAAVEAMAAGKPVAMFGRGGATETVIDGVTGVLFADQSPAGMVRALQRLEDLNFDPQKIRSRAENFDRHAFRRAFRRLLEQHGVEDSVFADDS